MNPENKLLIVVDPTANHHPAADRITRMLGSGIEGYQPEITLLFAIDHSSTDTSASNEAIYRDDQFLVDLVSPLRAAGLKVSIRISWSKDWADSIIQSADAVGATSIMVSHPGEDTSRSLSDEFWYLMRNSNVPVAIVQSTDTPELKNVLVALDLADKELEGLSRRTMENASALANAYGAKLHLASAYADSLQYPDRGRLVKLTGLPNDQIHIQMGNPDDVLADITNAVDPDMVVIGATRRTGIKAALRGKKISRIFSKIKHDILVVV